MFDESEFFATLRRIAGQKTVEFEVAEGATAQQVLDAILERFPAMREELLDEDGQLFPMFICSSTAVMSPTCLIKWPPSSKMATKSTCFPQWPEVDRGQS